MTALALNTTIAREPAGTVLADPALLNDLARRIRRDVPASEVDDLVQATLTEALASPILPKAADEVRRFVFVIARHKVVDFHRRRRREDPIADELPDASASPDEGASEELLRWAERELPKLRAAEQTLSWMLRESEGEKLADIAAGERIEPAVVRKRVSRLRRFLRERWVLQAGAIAVFIVGGLCGWRFARRPIAGPPPMPEPAQLPGAAPSASPSASAAPPPVSPSASASISLKPPAPPTVDMVLRAINLGACLSDSSLDGKTGKAVVLFDAAGRIKGATVTFDGDDLFGGPYPIAARCMGGLLGVARLPSSSAPSSTARAVFRIEGRKPVWKSSFAVDAPRPPPAGVLDTSRSERLDDF